MNESWLLSKNIYELDWYDRYIPSLYWSVITTLTVGYGDITPVIRYGYFIKLQYARQPIKNKFL